MSAEVETYTLPPQILLDTGGIRQRLDNFFKIHAPAGVAELRQSLESADTLVVDVTHVTQLTRELLDPAVNGITAMHKQQHIAEIPDLYTAWFSDGTAGVRSPRSLASRLKRQEPRVSESRLRADLTAARDEEVNTSQTKLAATIANDLTHDEPIPDSAIVASLCWLLEDTQSQIALAVLTLESASPPNRLQRIAGTVLPGLIGYEGKGNYTQEMTACIEMLAKLLGLINNPAELAGITAAQITQERARELDRVYDELACAELATLRDKIEAVYARIIPAFERLPQSVETQQEQPSGQVRTAKPAPAPEAEITHQASPHEEVLGKVGNHFPWGTHGPVEVSLFIMYGNALLFANAMQPADKELASKLRGRDAEGQFDAGLRKLCLIESGNNATSHSGIGIAQRSGFYGLTMCSLGYLGSGRRIYYIRTRLGRFPAMMTELDDPRINPSTTLILLMAETDKHHQVATLTHFGMPRHGARHRGVGSI